MTKFDIGKLTSFSLLLVGSMWLTGCGGGFPPAESVTPPPPPAVKAMLTDVATSGDLGSGAVSIREALTTLQATDSVKADALLKELDELETMSDPEEIKAKAQAMAESL